jgi:hypothetical protein
MRITAALDEKTVAALLDELLPVTIDLQESEPGTRWIRVEKPDHFEFVAGEGIRIHAGATIEWKALGLAIPATLKSVEVMLRPAIVVDEQRGGTLVFRPEVEAADFKLVPAFIDAQIARVINSQLAKESNQLAWHFAETLALRAPLPPIISPATQFELSAEDAVVQTTDDQLTLALTLSMRFARASEATSSPGD